MAVQLLRRSAIAVLALLAIFTLGPPASASASRYTTIPFDWCCPIDQVAAGGGLVVLSTDNTAGRIERLDPTTGDVDAMLPLGSPPNGDDYWNVRDLVVADGSLWVAMYWDDVVLRLDPVTLAIQARIPTGRSPAGLVYGGGALWTPLNHDRSVERIDPARNAVVQQIPVGRQRDLGDGPFKAAWDGSALLVSLPGSGRVAHVSADGRHVTYDNVGADAASCAALVPVLDGYWLDDTDCGIHYFHWSTSAGAVTAAFTTTGAWGSQVVDGVLYTGGSHCGPVVCRRGFVEKHDPTTGALLARRRVGTNEAWLPHVAFGQLWTYDYDNQRLQRSPLF